MRPLLRIARTEVLEHSRQRWMLFILVASYLVWTFGFSVVFVLVDRAVAHPETEELLRTQWDALGVDLDVVLRLSVSSFGSLMITNMPLYVAIIAGYSVLHDRTWGTMPFLMLAPITRGQILVGKLLGAMAVPLLLHLVFVGSVTVAFGQLDVLEPWSAMLGGSASWWVALLLGGPASAALVGALGTVISALSSDVRTSMQYTSFFMGLLGLVIGITLVDGSTGGVALQVGFAVGCLVVAGLTLLVGAQIISRDVRPS